MANAHGQRGNLYSRRSGSRIDRYGSAIQPDECFCRGFLFGRRLGFNLALETFFDVRFVSPENSELLAASLTHADGYFVARETEVGHSHGDRRS